MIFRSRYSIGKVQKVSKKSIGAHFHAKKKKIKKAKSKKANGEYHKT